MLNLDTGTRRVFTTPVSGQPIRTPAVSPDGRRIIFQVSHDGAWLLDLRNGSMRRVLDDPTAEEYSWVPRRSPRRLPQPQGRRLGRMGHGTVEIGELVNL